MDSFTEALLSEKTDRIPDEYDWFAPLLGDWDCDYFDEPSEGHKRHVKGEWLFRRILEGAGIQDIFIFPSRATKETEPQPDGEYGSSFRMFNKAEGYYDGIYLRPFYETAVFHQTGRQTRREGSFRRKRILDILRYHRRQFPLGKCKTL